MYLSRATFKYHNGSKGQAGKNGAKGSSKKHLSANTPSKSPESLQPRGGCRAVRSPYSRIL